MTALYDHADPYGTAPADQETGPGPNSGASTGPGPGPSNESAYGAGTSATRRRPTRAAASLLLACLLSGGAGGLVVHALADDATSTSGPALVTRGTTTPAAVGPGTTQAAAATISPSVVTIAVTGRQALVSRSGQTVQQVSDTGSGIVLQSDGYVVTNNHVVAAAVDGGAVSVTFTDGSTVPGKIVGTDATSDLAVLKVDKKGLTAAVFADSDRVAVGQPVLAVGAPLGLSNTVTEGIVSTLHRPVRTGEQGATEQSVLDAVQTDAAINPGNSGGALVDLAGQVVGVNTAIASTGGGGAAQSGNIGVGFAIPSNDVAEVAQELIADGRAKHPLIGVSTADAPAAANGIPGLGALVQDVAAGGPAASAGLQRGDIITWVGDRPVTDADSLIVAVRSHDPGDTVTVTYRRGSDTRTATARLTEAPSR